MKKLLSSPIVTIGLAIFSMFFGAGNLIYPLAVGLQSGDNLAFGIAGFLCTAVCLPLIALIAMILFDGNYEAFFDRLGHKIGSLVIFLCMVIIGPGLAIPRIVSLSHIMTAPFLPIALLQEINPLSSFIFALIFLGITFLITFRENSIVDILGSVISPLLLISLGIILVKGFLGAETMITSTDNPLCLFGRNLIRGYETLDLLAGIFFCSIVLSILKRTDKRHSTRYFIVTGLKGGILGVTLLGGIYVGMSFLGAYYGQGIVNINPGELFRTISFTILGSHGAAIIACAVFMACLSTSIALSAVVAEYFQKISGDRFNFVPALIVTCLLTIPLSTAGLDKVLALTGGPITYIGYPTLIALTICNILYKTVGFKPVRFPVALTFIGALISYMY